MTQHTFKSIYKSLNSTQRQAVDAIEGPVMVVAGPGTGKTQILAARIANILKETDTQPHQILALTFTESAAKNMKERLVEMIGKAGYYVNISTFHSFCSEVIQTHPEYFVIGRGSEPLTDLERFELFQSLIIDTKLEVLKPLNRPLFYLSEVIKGISDLKREGVSVDDFKKLLKQEQAALSQLKKNDGKKVEIQSQQKKLAKQQELLKLYHLYQQKLKKHLRYDFDDMISFVLEAFGKHEELLLEYQEKLHYFLVDEYQDTNSAQNKVVNLLASYWGEQANIFVVGDPNQAIYRFQGASVENALGFVDTYPGAKVVFLELGYRCPQNIYDLAVGLISNNTLAANQKLIPINQPLKSHHQTSGRVKVITADSPVVELVQVAQEISSLLKKKVPAEQIAVLYRNNSDAHQLQEVFDKHNLKCEVDGGSNVLKNPYLLQFLTLLQVIRDIQQGKDPENLFELLLYEWFGFEPLLVMKASRMAGDKKISLFKLIYEGSSRRSVSGKKTTVTLSELELSILKNAADQLVTWSVRDAQLPLVHFFEEVLNQSGFLKWITGDPIKTELLIHLNSLFREVKALASANPKANLESLLKTLEVMSTFGISLRSEDLNVRQSAVHLSTVHKAKGREWQYVFLIHCTDGKWGNIRQRNLLPLPETILKKTDLSEKERNEDERRLFYVALTRAKKQVVISHSLTKIVVNKSQDVTPSMFIHELKETGLKISQVETQVQEESDELMLGLFQDTLPSYLKIDQKAFFRKLLERFKLSVTVLNTYLRDPQEFVENYLLKVPRATPEPLAFGSAVHAALERFYRDWQVTGEKPDLKLVFKVFESTLLSQLLPEADYKRRLEYGRQVLTNYYQQTDLSSANILDVERFFGSGWSRVYLDDIPLVGRIDRVDWLDIKEKTVAVIDYKTGSAKSSNFIEGKLASQQLSERELALPESVRGPYKRQLLFYKLLTDLDPTFVPTATKGVFEFVEPNKSGKLVAREFELKKEDVTDLKKLIKQVVKEVRQLKFLSITTSN